jgi:hypothetical protein
MLLTLGPETRLEFRSTPSDDGRLFLRTASGREEVVGVKIGQIYRDDQPVIVDPLSRLSPAEIRNLRGVQVGEWNDRIAAELNGINPQRACVTVTSSVGSRTGGKLPHLPAGLFYLCIDSFNEISELSRLRDQSSLRFLSIYSFRTHDTADLSQAVDLRYLDLCAGQLLRPSSLSALRSLRSLTLKAYAGDLHTLAFASELRHLVELDIQGAAIEDLSPLNGSDALVSVNAYRSQIRRLPKGALRNLRRLQVMSTQLSDEDVAAFARSHPSCFVLFRWDAVLRTALEGTTRVRVAKDIDEKPLFEVKEPAEITALVEMIHVDEPASGFHCLCIGDQFFEFDRNDSSIRLSLHHARSLRLWSELWPDDALLTRASAHALCTWLARHGLTDALDEFNAEERAAGRRKDAVVSKTPPTKTVVSGGPGSNESR